MIRYDEAPSLYRAYEGEFLMGAAIAGWMPRDGEYRALIRRHFNSFTAENDMKPERILDRAATLALNDRVRTAQDFTRTDEMLSFAKENGIKVRFHVLCWHNQTPRWFFAENWSDAPEAAPTDRETLLARLESYIRDVMTHVNERFPGVVYAWDVVNEAIEPDQGEPHGYRTRSPWYQALGGDFIPAAFRAARKFKAPGQKLFYNDYNAFQPEKRNAILALLRKLQAEGLADGMGMQGHMSVTEPPFALCEEAVRAYAGLGLEVQVTELDLHCPGDDAAAQQALADRYAAYFDMLLRLKAEGCNITSVTFWGVTDRDSWLSGFRRERSYPLLFSDDKQAKPAFDAVVALPEKRRNNG